MSYIQRLSIQQRRGKRITNFQDQQKQTLRETMMKRANKVKQKIVQQTNTFDYSVQKLMNQTLSQVRKHKQDFQQQHNHLALIYKDEQYERKKALLKEELHKKLETCKNRYKQKISLIKNKKGRFYTSNNKTNQQKISVEDMLRTAKNRFKFQREGNTNKQRNKSEIIQLKKINQKQIINFVHKNYPGPCALKFQSNVKQDYDNISIDMIKVKESKNFQSSASMKGVGNDDLSPQKLHATQMISMPSQSSNKSLMQNLKNKRILYPSGYSKFNQSNVQNLSNSEKSIFIPMGKVALSNQRKRMITDFQVTNTHKRQRKNQANKLSSDIVAEFVEIQLSQKKQRQNTRVFLPLNKKLKTQMSVKLKDKKVIIENLTPSKTPRLYDEMESQQINLSKCYKEKSPISKYFQNQEQKIQQKDLNEIQCIININDLKVQGNNQEEKDKNILKNKQNSGLKSILYNRKVNQLSRKMMKNHMNSRVPQKKHLSTQFSLYDQTSPKYMFLDIKGSHMQLQKSVKAQKSKQTFDHDQYLYQ